MAKEQVLDRIAEDFLQVLRKGHCPPPEDYYVRKCPPLEKEIRSLLQSLRQMEQFSEHEMFHKRRGLSSKCSGDCSG